MKKVFTYLALVGVPFLGVTGILHVGANLRPTMNINGPWTMEVRGQDTSCPALKTAPTGFSITQTGQNFSVTLNNTNEILHGEIQGTDINATLLKSSTSLRATVDRHAGSTHLWGVLSFAQCPSVSFVATQSETISSGRR